MVQCREWVTVKTKQDVQSVDWSWFWIIRGSGIDWFGFDWQVQVIDQEQIWWLDGRGRRRIVTWGFL